MVSFLVADVSGVMETGGGLEDPEVAGSNVEQTYTALEDPSGGLPVSVCEFPDASITLVEEEVMLLKRLPCGPDVVMYQSCLNEDSDMDTMHAALDLDPDVGSFVVADLTHLKIAGVSGVAPGYPDLEDYEEVGVNVESAAAADIVTL